MIKDISVLIIMEGCTGEYCDFSQNRNRAHLLHHAKNKIPTKIKFSERNIMPCRNDFLDPEHLSITKEMISKKQPVSFLTNDVAEPIVWANGGRAYEPYLFGVLPCGSKVAVILTGVPVYFDVKLPEAPDRFSEEPMLKISGINDNFITEISTACIEQGINLVKTEIIQMLPAGEFSLTTHPYARLHFANLDDRKKCYDYVKSRKDRPATSSDDTGSNKKIYYLQKVAREYKFAMADWNTVKNYTVVEGKTNCAYTLRVNVANFTAMTAEDRTSVLNSPMGRAIDFDHTIVAQWDIETKGELPDFKQNNIKYNLKHFNTDKYQIFMINSSYYSHWDTKSHIDVCCTDNDLNVDSRKCKEKGEKNTMITIVCSCDKDVLAAHIHVMALMKPDILSAFNGGGFDWPMCREKMWKYKQLGDLKRSLHSIIELDKYYDNDNVWRFSFDTNKHIKLSAERDHVIVCSSRFAGVVDTDVMLNFLKVYPRAEIPKAASLNFFLKDNKLDGKEDMPYKKMFKIYDRAVELRDTPKECHCAVVHNSATCCNTCNSHIPEIDCIENERVAHDHPDRYSKEIHADIRDKCCFCGKRPRNLQDMELVAIYCRIDCQRPQELNVKRGIMGDKRALATLAFVPLLNTFYLADGEKVRNMMAAYCFDYGVAFSNVTLEKGDHEKDHNVGGYVVPPKRGRYDVPITGLDFESLYPSLMATYNLSPDMIVSCEKFAMHLEKLGYKLHKITDESNEYLEYSRGEKKDDPTNKKFRVVSWTVRHNGILTKQDTHIITGYDDNYKPIYGRKALPRERMGYMAFIVKSLKELRLPIKNQRNKCHAEIEVLEHLIANNTITEEQRDRLAYMEFMYKKTLSQDGSIKVLNNTFYGQVSSFRNSFYDIRIAGGITSAGRKNTKMIKQFVTERGFFVAYGDTDSLYIACPESVYAESRKKYEISGEIPKENRVAFYTEMVEIAMKVMKDLSAVVYRKLVEDNGTLFLRMAYEEVGLPTVLCGRKKYYMIAHEGTINFKPQHMFIRGIEVKKQGQTQVSRNLQMDYMWASLDINLDKSLFDLGVEHVQRFFNVKQNPADFAKMAAYKPDKKNVSVLTFIARMRTEGKFIPEAGDKFRTVVVNKPQQYNLRGTMIKQSIGDKKEYLHEFERLVGTPDEMELDMDYYLDAGIYGAFARFIAYHPRFQLENADMDNPAEYKRADEYSVKEAYKYLADVCSKYLKRDRAAEKQESALLRKEYGMAAKAVKASHTYSPAITNALYGRALGTKSDEKAPALYVEKLIENIRLDHTLSFAERYVAKRMQTEDIYLLKKKHTVDIRERVAVLSRLQDKVILELMQVLRQSWKIRDDHRKTVDNCLTSGLPLEDLCEESQNVLYNVDKLILQLRGIIFTKMNVLAIGRAIEVESRKCADIEFTPRINVRELAKHDSKSAEVIDDYVFG